MLSSVEHEESFITIKPGLVMCLFVPFTFNNYLSKKKRAASCCYVCLCACVYLPVL